MSKLNTLTFFSNSTCYLSHIVRLVLAEKGIDARILGISEQAFSYARIPATPDPSRP
ncbi:hypothetical protein [Pseudomonas aeruginosa]|uniref:hypothetical protein n=1 Tax=Pseudomonas aeruginosa TaxID=287 RepID=UPI0024BF20B5|nr:hypothetical protein [Pseudomonas aeruginosa]WHV80525.1 hypothetical protein M2I96_32685 [Pseudomonas aeruginosa]